MSTSPTAIKVLLAHSDPVVNAGLQALLGACLDMQVCSADIGTAVLLEARHDVVIANHADGLAHLERLKKMGRAYRERVLIVTHREREWDVRTAMTAGAHGYLLQHCGADLLVEAVRAVGNGLRYVDKQLLHCVAESCHWAGLTSREHDVLHLLARGCCNKSIARELGIGVGTVKSHVKGVFGKLGATARTHAVALATQRGLVN